MLVYILFFNMLIASFSILLATSKARAEYEAQKQALPLQIVATLEKNGLIDTGIKIIENNQVNSDFLQEIGINEFMARTVTIKKNGETIINVVLSADGKELYRVIEPGEQDGAQ